MSSTTTETAQPKPIEFDPKIQLGRSGLKQYGGFVFEEFLPQLRGQRGAAAYREIIENSALVGGIYRLIELSLRRVEKFVEPFSMDAEDVMRADRVEKALSDMSDSWEDTISEICTMVLYGFSPMEIIYKKCLGWSDDPTTRSQYKDGFIMWRKIALRAQDTLFRWDFDDDGGVRAMVQLPPPDYRMRTIPIEKLLLFRPRVEKGNPEGSSVLRSGYYNWLMIKRLTEFEAIKGERDATGVPLIKMPAINMSPTATSEQQRVFTAMKTLGKNLRNDDQAVAIIPSDVDPNTKMPLFSLDLMKGEGRTIFDYDKVITRHEVRLALSMLADGMLLGHDKVGSFALSKSKAKDTTAVAMEAWLDSICGVFNRHALPRVFDMNGWPMDRMPTMGHGDVQVTDLEALAHTIQMLAAAGMALFPDDDLDAHIREEMNWPARNSEAAENSGRDDTGGDVNDTTAEDAQPQPQKPAFGKRRRSRVFVTVKAKHQPRSHRGKYAPAAASDALALLRDRQTIGAGDMVAHGFKMADPPPFDPKAMSHILNVDDAPLHRVALRDMVATQPAVRREQVRAFVENPNIIAAGQRNLAGQLTDRPVVVRHNGTNFIADGHHRLAAKKVMGAQDALVRVVELEPHVENGTDPTGSDRVLASIQKQDELKQQDAIAVLTAERDAARAESGAHLELLSKLAVRTDTAPPEFHFHQAKPQDVNVSVQPASVQPADVKITVEPAVAPVINVAAPEVHLGDTIVKMTAPPSPPVPDIQIHVNPTPVEIKNEVSVAAPDPTPININVPPPAAMKRVVVRDEKEKIAHIIDVPIPEDKK